MVGRVCNPSPSVVPEVLTGYKPVPRATTCATIYLFRQDRRHGCPRHQQEGPQREVKPQANPDRQAGKTDGAGQHEPGIGAALGQFPSAVDALASVAPVLSAR